MKITKPIAEDGQAIYQLVNNCPPLEPNTCYAYLLLCTHFADTSIVAKDEEGVAGFVAAYRPPTHPDAIFVWQVGVSERARGQGLAQRMLNELFARLQPEGVRYLESTVTPSNTASRKLFSAFARKHNVSCDVLDGYPAELFGAGDHEAEDLFRIGPIDSAIQ
jgi:L-2,4-diaminobutyric acid acetyltransferase